MRIFIIVQWVQEGRKKQNKFENYLNDPQQGTSQISLWCIPTMENYEAIIILLRFIYPNLEHFPCYSFKLEKHIKVWLYYFIF